MGGTYLLTWPQGYDCHNILRTAINDVWNVLCGRRLERHLYAVAGGCIMYMYMNTPPYPYGNLAVGNLHFPYSSMHFIIPVPYLRVPARVTFVESRDKYAHTARRFRFTRFKFVIPTFCPIWDRRRYVAYYYIIISLIIQGFRQNPNNHPQERM